MYCTARRFSLHSPLSLRVPTLRHVLAETGSFLVTFSEHNQTMPNIFHGREDVKQGSQHQLLQLSELGSQSLNLVGNNTN